MITEEEPFQQNIENFREFFLKDIKSQEYILKHSSFKKLQNLMEQSFNTKTLSIALLFGCNGSGRLTAVKKSSSIHSIDNSVILDAKMLDQDNIMQRELLIKLEKTIKISKKKELDKDIDLLDEEEIENVKEYVYENAFLNKKILIYIDNIDVLLSKKRQTFFYTFLDDLKYYSNKPFLVLGTNNLYMLDLLERRVKSRFTHTSFFFGMEEQHIKDYLSNLKIKGLEKNTMILKILTSKFITDKLQYIFAIQPNYDLVFKILGGSFVLLDEKNLNNILNGSLDNGIKTYAEFLDKSIDMFTGVKINEIIRSLPDLDKEILLDLYDIWKQEDPSIILIIKDLMSYRSENAGKKNHKYSSTSIFRALKNLHDLNLIYSQDIPITLYSRFCIKFEHDVISTLLEEN